MTRNDLIAALRASRADDWKVLERRREGFERYFVGRETETVRSTDVVSLEATVYVDAGEGEARKRGECSFKILSGSTASEIGSAVERAVETARGAPNSWFPLPGPEEGGESAARESAARESAARESAARESAARESAARAAGAFASAMDELVAAAYRHDGVDGARINSLELFLSRFESRVTNSRGLDVSWTTREGNADFVVNAGSGADEVELWAEFPFAEPDPARFGDFVRSRLAEARDRLAAKPTPAVGALPLLLTGELAAQLYGYWFANAQAAAVYDRYGAFAVGEDLGSPGAGGDRMEMRAIPSLPSSPYGGPRDRDGIALAPVSLVEGGVLARLVAGTKHSAWLGIPRTGAIALFDLGPGSASESELRAIPHVEVGSFSDFFVDPTGGDFGGEIRLGWICRDGKRESVTGGSVTGSMPANRGAIRLSRELYDSAFGRGPAACLVPNVSLSPAD